MAVATHLADKSALARLHHEPVARRLGPMIEVGLVGTCGIIELEIRYSARSHPEYEAISRDRSLGYEWFPTPDEIWDRALEIQSELSARGQLRSVALPGPAHRGDRRAARTRRDPLRRGLRHDRRGHGPASRVGRSSRRHRLTVTARLRASPTSRFADASGRTGSSSSEQAESPSLRAQPTCPACDGTRNRDHAQATRA